MIKSIPLNKLVASNRNVRRLGNMEADLELKADIEAHGLLQNLVVTSLAKPRGHHAVEAGERRRRALQALADEGKLDKSHEVSCLVIENAAAEEASLAENFQRLAMNPADECLAFRKLVEQGADPAFIARRFGLTIRFVEGRLRLAALAPAVFAALGAGEISLDVAKAYGATADPERQAHVFEQVTRSFMAHHPDTIRRLVTNASVGASDRLASFIGEAAYVEAGGRVERDLFTDDQEARWLDATLVEQLAAQKLERLAGEAAEQAGLAWVRPVVSGWLSFSDMEGLRRLELESPPLSVEENAAVDALVAEIEELARAADHEDADEPAREVADRRMRELASKIDNIVSKAPIVPDELKGSAGAFLMLDRFGQPLLDSRRFVQAEPDDEASLGEPKSPHGSASDEAAGTASTILPRRLVDELAMQRRDLLAVHVAADRDFAFDLAAFLMADTGGGYVSEPSGSALRAGRPSDPAADFKAPDLAASVALLSAREALDTSWTVGKSRAERFDAFRALTESSRRLWFSFAIARTLEPSANVEGARNCPFHDHLGGLLGIEVERWWRPTAVGYFDQVPKALAIRALGDIGGDEFTKPYAKLRKSELAEACERIFAGDAIVEAEVKQSALGWVPEAMRFPPLAKTRAADPGDCAAGSTCETLEPPPQKLDEAA